MEETCHRRDQNDPVATFLQLGSSGPSASKSHESCLLEKGTSPIPPEQELHEVNVKIHIEGVEEDPVASDQMDTPDDNLPDPLKQIVVKIEEYSDEESDLGLLQPYMPVHTTEERPQSEQGSFEAEENGGDKLDHQWFCDEGTQESHIVREDIQFGATVKSVQESEMQQTHGDERRDISHSQEIESSSNSVPETIHGKETLRPFIERKVDHGSELREQVLPITSKKQHSGPNQPAANILPLAPNLHSAPNHPSTSTQTSKASTWPPRPIQPSASFIQPLALSTPQTLVQLKTQGNFIPAVSHNEKCLAWEKQSQCPLRQKRLASSPNKFSSSVQTPVSIQLSTDPKPPVEIHPIATLDPSDSKKPAVVIQPSASTQPTLSIQPPAHKKPVVLSQPLYLIRPSAPTQPPVSIQSSGAIQPNMKLLLPVGSKFAPLPSSTTDQNRALRRRPPVTDHKMSTHIKPMPQHAGVARRRVGRPKKLLLTIPDGRADTLKEGMRPVRFKDCLLNQMANSEVSRIVQAIQVKKNDDSYLGVFAIRSLPKWTHFGPLQGNLVEDKPETSLTWPVIRKGKRMYIDCGNYGNWMGLVRPAQEEQQNMKAVSLNGDIYFVTMETIAPCKELKVGYSKSLADSLLEGKADPLWQTDVTEDNQMKMEVEAGNSMQEVVQPWKLLKKARKSKEEHSNEIGDDQSDTGADEMESHEWTWDQATKSWSPLQRPSKVNDDAHRPNRGSCHRRPIGPIWNTKTKCWTHKVPVRWRDMLRSYTCRLCFNKFTSPRTLFQHLFHQHQHDVTHLYNVFKNRSCGDSNTFRTLLDYVLCEDALTPDKANSIQDRSETGPVLTHQNITKKVSVPLPGTDAGDDLLAVDVESNNASNVSKIEAYQAEMTDGATLVPVNQNAIGQLHDDAPLGMDARSCPLDAGTESNCGSTVGYIKSCQTETNEEDRVVSANENIAKRSHDLVQCVGANRNNPAADGNVLPRSFNDIAVGVRNRHDVISESLPDATKTAHGDKTDMIIEPLNVYEDYNQLVLDFPLNKDCQDEIANLKGLSCNNKSTINVNREESTDNNEAIPSNIGVSASEGDAHDGISPSEKGNPSGQAQPSSEGDQYVHEGVVHSRVDPEESFLLETESLFPLLSEVCRFSLLCPYCKLTSNPMPPDKCHRCEMAYTNILCDACGLFFSRVKFPGHYRAQHEWETFVTTMCDMCGQYVNMSSIKRHRKYVCNERKKPKTHTCPTCGKSFFNADKLRKHSYIHMTDLPYKCEFCGRSFAQASNMKHHLRQHTGEQPYKCDICPRTFTHNVSRKTHLKKVHGIDLWKQGQTGGGRPKQERAEPSVQKKKGTCQSGGIEGEGEMHPEEKDIDGTKYTGKTNHLGRVVEENYPKRRSKRLTGKFGNVDKPLVIIGRPGDDDECVDEEEMGPRQPRKRRRRRSNDSILGDRDYESHIGNSS